jgi:hypothetical protein
MELSPLNGLVLPTRAEYVPVCAVVLTPVEPAEVQPLSEPVSKPPLTMPEPPPPLGVTVSDTVAVCVADAPVPVMVTA